MRCFVVFLVVCLPFYCRAFSPGLFFSGTAENKDGDIRINFTLNDNVEGTTMYAFFSQCNSNDSDSLELELGVGSTSFPSCEMTDTTGLRDCCDDDKGCIEIGEKSASIVLEGPVTAGDNFSCTVLGFVDEATDYIDMNSFIALTGIPSDPFARVLSVQSDCTVKMLVGSTYNGSDDAVTFEVLVQLLGAEDDIKTTVFKKNYTSMMFSFKVKENGEYNITVWTINEYGRSSATTISTEVTSSCSPSKSDCGLLIAAIVGGVVAGVIVIIVIVVVVVVALKIKKNKTTGSLRISPNSNVV